MLISEVPLRVRTKVFLSPKHISASKRAKLIFFYLHSYLRTYIYHEGILLFHAAILQGYIINIEDN